MVHYGKSLLSVFQEFFDGIDKFFMFVGKLCARLSIILWSIDNFLIFPNFRRQLVRQHLYTMFISNNRASFHLW